MQRVVGWVLVEMYDILSAWSAFAACLGATQFLCDGHLEINVPLTIICLILSAFSAALLYSTIAGDCPGSES